MHTQGTVAMDSKKSGLLMKVSRGVGDLIEWKCQIKLSLRRVVLVSDSVIGVTESKE